MSPDAFLPRFTFFFDISISFFEEIAKFRAGRRIWARLTRERYGAQDPRSWRFKFHGQTSGVDLTRQQPLNNIARVTAQAIAGIFGGLQSLHTDAYDEPFPPDAPAHDCSRTPGILREEAHLTGVSTRSAGALRRALTGRMKEDLRIMLMGGCGRCTAVESGWCKRSAVGAPSRRSRVGRADGRGVNAYQVEEDRSARQRWPSRSAHMRDLSRSSQGGALAPAVRKALALGAAAQDPRENVFGKVVEAAEAGCTHGEICGTLRRELGFGHPLAVV
jgi:methylmalonyl-CoA mutase N-terminal domain/subunit